MEEESIPKFSVKMTGYDMQTTLEALWCEIERLKMELENERQEKLYEVDMRERRIRELEAKVVE